jgi:hypothetical protein
LAQRPDGTQDQIRQTLASLPDVDSCRIDFDPAGAIAAVHIVSRSKRAAKQIVRDVESVLAADFGTKIDHRKISIARLETRPAGGARIEKVARPRFVGMRLSTSGARGTCEVMLDRDDVEVTGEATGVTTGPSRLRLVAKATFHAVEKLVDDDVEFDLLDVIRMKAGGRETLIVLATFVSPRGPRNLAGCVQFDDNEQQAAVLASLDACNRIIEISPQVERTEYEISPYTDR